MSDPVEVIHLALNVIQLLAATAESVMQLTKKIAHTSDLTPQQKKAIDDQFDQIADRLAQMLGATDGNPS